MWMVVVNKEVPEVYEFGGDELAANLQYKALVEWHKSNYSTEDEVEIFITKIEESVLVRSLSSESLL